MEHVKWTDKIKYAVMLEMIKEDEKKLAATVAKKELRTEGCGRRNGKREAGSRQKKTPDDREHHDKWTIYRYKKEG